MSTETISTNTTAEVIYTPEESLPAVSAAQVKQLRALNHDGQSVNTTTDALREMVGMDYSLLTEQVVPGEYWRGMDGVKKQVYVRTFVGTTPENAPNDYSFDSMILDSNITEAMCIRGTIDMIPPYSFISSGGINFNNNFYWTYYSYPNVGLSIMSAAASITSPTDYNPVNNLGGKPYNLTFKYTKR